MTTMPVEIPVKPNSNRKVVFTDTAILSGGVSLAFSEVIGITFYSGYSQGRLFDNSAGIVILRSPSKRLKISIRNFGFWGLGHSMVNNYSKICDEVMRHIGPLVAQRLIREILAGGTIHIGRLAIDSTGVTSTSTFGGRRRASWDLSPEIRVTGKDYWYVAMTKGGILEVSYFYPPTGKMITIGSVTSREENGCLLSSILSFMNARYKAHNA